MDDVLQCLGISHHTAEVALREQFAGSENGATDLLRRTQNRLGLNELVVLSTCNRVEFYFTSPDATDAFPDQLIPQRPGLSNEGIRSSLYHFFDLQVASHLFRVAAGLDSKVLGEPQILGQVSQAHQEALEAGTAGNTISRLFQSAVHAGKRVRSETGIGKNPTSIPSIAAQLASERADPLPKAHIVLLGAGEMAELSVEALRKRGARQIQVINRTLAGACQLAERWEGEAGALDELATAVQSADLVITSSSAPHLLITKDMVVRAMQSRPQRPMTIIDIAFPRDVEPEVNEIPNVRVYDLDALDRDLDSELTARLREVPKVEAILAEELDAFKEYLRQQEVFPLIVQMRDRAEEIRQRELQRGLKRLDGLSEEQMENLALLTRSLVNKILHQPTLRLRGAASNGDHEAYVNVVKELFGLQDPDLLDAECQR